MTDSIQPDNRSALQVAIEQALDDRIRWVDDQAPLPELFDGSQTPAQFLTSLAIEVGVTDWDISDSEEAKRRIVKTSLQLQSKACTAEGIDDSLSMLGNISSVKRLRPYVIGLETEIIDGSLDIPFIKRIIRRIDTYKAARDSVEANIVRSSDLNFSTGVISEVSVISDSIAFKMDVSADINNRTLVLSETLVISDCEAANV
ncbi:phage tail protein [Aeromonas popoffii]|uniref:phage tail protein n=1 Tax=Aeromonas popoffii TaxID=70856 RepID=UPI0005AAD1A6|nr:phage tail protein [Aeromonas popoffii]